MFVETHIHLTMKEFSEDLDEVLARARKERVERFITIGLDDAHYGETWQQAAELSAKYDDVYLAVSVHPHEARNFTDEHLIQLEHLARTHKRFVAIGECGLDYYYDHSPRDVQQAVFREFIRVAKHLNLPLIVHSRNAAEDTLRILKEEKAHEIGGVIHCFGYSADEAKEFVKLGFYIGIGGVITYKRAKRLREAAVAVGINRILLETDAPFLAPHPFRGKRNEPAYIPRIAAALAETLGISVDDVEAKTTQNAFELFALH